MAKPDGGRVFPSSLVLGLSLRDYLAGLAMQAWISRSLMPTDGEVVADKAYRIADAMIAEREQDRA
jgi:hypothetical protein